MSENDKPHGARQHWPQAIKERLWSLVQEGRTTDQALELLAAETGAQVPAGTAHKWITAAREARNVPAGRAPAVNDMSIRVAALLSRELTMLERRARRKPLDLDRLDKIARTLAKLDGMTPIKPRTPGPRTLAELTETTPLNGSDPAGLRLLDDDESA